MQLLTKAVVVVCACNWSAVALADNQCREMLKRLAVSETMLEMSVACSHLSQTQQSPEQAKRVVSQVIDTARSTRAEQFWPICHDLAGAVQSRERGKIALSALPETRESERAYITMLCIVGQSGQLIDTDRQVLRNELAICEPGVRPYVALRCGRTCELWFER